MIRRFFSRPAVERVMVPLVAGGMVFLIFGLFGADGLFGALIAMIFFDLAYWAKTGRWSDF